jgi:hypothetical protein
MHAAGEDLGSSLLPRENFQSCKKKKKALLVPPGSDPFFFLLFSTSQAFQKSPPKTVKPCLQ